MHWACRRFRAAAIWSALPPVMTSARAGALCRGEFSLLTRALVRDGRRGDSHSNVVKAQDVAGVRHLHPLSLKLALSHLHLDRILAHHPGAAHIDAGAIEKQFVAGA